MLPLLNGKLSPKIAASNMVLIFFLTACRLSYNNKMVDIY